VVIRRNGEVVRTVEVRVDESGRVQVADAPQAAKS